MPVSASTSALAQSRPEAALAETEREKRDLWLGYGLSMLYHAVGRTTEADATLSELIKHYEDTAAYQIAEAHAFRGEVDPRRYGSPCNHQPR